MSNSAEALNRLRSGRKGSFAETGYWIERRSVGRQENMLPAVTFRGALSSLPDNFYSDGNRPWRCALWSSLFFARGIPFYTGKIPQEVLSG